jgi:hypothetical protein
MRRSGLGPALEFCSDVPIGEGRMKRYKIGTRGLYIEIVPKKIARDASRAQAHYFYRRP